MSRRDVFERGFAVGRFSRATLIAFAVLVVIGGSNAVAVRFSNLELPPFWGAALRFSAAALIFWMIVLVRRIELPKGRALIGTIFYGLITIGASYAFLYWALVRIQAGLGMVVLAFVPLLTLFFAWAHGQERISWRGLVGALVAIAGIVFGVAGTLGASAPIPPLLAVVAGAACMAEGSVVFKTFPKSDPVATNALAVTTGSLLLFGLSFAAGEEWQLPATANTWSAFTYLVVIGSVVLFYLYLYVLARWTASATAYSFLLFPVTTVIIAALIAGEALTPSFVVGGILVLAGVWLGALSGSTRARATDRAPAGAAD